MTMVGIAIVIIIIAGVAGYYTGYNSGNDVGYNTGYDTGYDAAMNVTRLKETLVMGTTDSVESCLDPTRAYDFFGWEIIQSLGCGLVEYKAGATGSIDDIVPSLATSWSVSDDGLVWTFNLRQGVYYEDNTTEFNATHVKYTFDRGIGIADEDGAFVGIGYDGIINNVTVSEKYVVKFYLKIPFAAFLSLMACQASYIVDPAHAPMTSVVE